MKGDRVEKDETDKREDNGTRQAVYFLVKI